MKQYGVHNIVVGTVVGSEPLGKDLMGEERYRHQIQLPDGTDLAPSLSELERYPCRQIKYNAKVPADFIEKARQEEIVDFHRRMRNGHKVELDFCDVTEGGKTAPRLMRLTWTVNEGMCIAVDEEGWGKEITYQEAQDKLNSALAQVDEKPQAATGLT